MPTPNTRVLTHRHPGNRWQINEIPHEWFHFLFYWANAMSCRPLYNAGTGWGWYSRVAFTTYATATLTPTLKNDATVSLTIN